METGLIVGLFVGIFLLVDALCEICQIQEFERTRVVIKLLMGIVLFALANVGLFLK